MDEKSKDIWLGISLFICCVLMYFVVIPFAVYVPKSVKISSLSPAYWPKIITVTTAFLSLVILFSGITKKKMAVQLLALIYTRQKAMESTQFKRGT